MEKQNAEFETVYHSKLKQCAYYPQRPALRFIPHPDMIHIMLMQAVILQFPKYRPNVPIKGKVDFNKLGNTQSKDSLGKKGLNATTGSLVDTQYSGFTEGSGSKTSKRGSALSKGNISKVSKN